MFFVQAGLSTSNSFSLSLGNYALGAVGTIASWWTMNYVSLRTSGKVDDADPIVQQFGRRELYFWGLAAMTVVLLGVGGTGFSHSSGGSWAAGDRKSVV